MDFCEGKEFLKLGDCFSELEEPEHHKAKKHLIRHSHAERFMFLICLQVKGSYFELVHAQAADKNHPVPGTHLDVTVPKNVRTPCFLEVQD